MSDINKNVNSGTGGAGPQITNAESAHQPPPEIIPIPVSLRPSPEQSPAAPSLTGDRDIAQFARNHPNAAAPIPVSFKVYDTQGVPIPPTGSLETNATASRLDRFIVKPDNDFTIRIPFAKSAESDWKVLVKYSQSGVIFGKGQDTQDAYPVAKGDKEFALTLHTEGAASPVSPFTRVNIVFLPNDENYVQRAEIGLPVPLVGKQ